ncbi:MAG: ABC transporter permease subunit [Sedimentisphaerales bacterium]|nr:ABC transporter permease subunit [Sedimentisphaerales bacterium]
MAIAKQTYRQYNSTLTPARMRFAIFSRFYYAPLFQSKFIVLFLAACLFYPIGCAAYIYITNNSMLIMALSLRPDFVPAIDGSFFYSYSIVQGTMALLLTTLIGPNLIAPDLANGALSLYLSRPVSRTQYILGKMIVLLSLESLITWVPGVLLFVIKAEVTGFEWARNNAWLVGATVIGLSIWIIMLSLIALTLSALVKWRIAAGALILGIFFVGAGFGNAINSILHTNYGSLINLSEVIRIIWAYLYRHGYMDTNLTTFQACSVLFIVCILCLIMLAKRVRAFEVVK